METELQESVDFDFFDEPISPTKDRGDKSPSSPPSKPPIRPLSAKPVTSNTDSAYNNKSENDIVRRRRSPSRSSSKRSKSPDYSSDTFSDSEDNKDTISPNRKNSVPRKERRARSKSSSSVSSFSRSHCRSRSSSYSDRSGSRKHSSSPQNQQAGSKVLKSRNSSGSDSESRPSNPIAKGESHSLPKRGKSRQGEDEYSSSAFSDGEDSSAKKSYKHDSRRKRQAWGDSKESKGRGGRQTSAISEGNRRGRPKTAKGGRGNGSSDRRRKSRSQSGTETLSDSDITDVSPMDSPRNGFQSKYKDRRDDKSRMTAAGDGRHMKPQFRPKPVTDLDSKDDSDHDRDRSNGLDLDILMKAVGELEKQKRLQANSRRVMFAPMTLKRGEKANYTFDENKTRDIERENQRLLKEIVRRVQSGDQRKQFYKTPSTYKLTASAVNRDKEMRRIETENLAFLRRLQNVKPTKSICRDNQLRAYETTTLHGVPIAALHPMPKGGRRSVISDSTSSIGSRTRSMTSINSASSSVCSVGSRRSSRPSSASKRPGSATRHIDNRPEWSDRW